MSSLFEYIVYSSLVSLQEVKLTAIVNWNFYVSNFWRLITIFFYSSLILGDILWLISFYSYFHYFHIPYNYYSKNYRLLPVYNNIFLLFQNGLSVLLFYFQFRFQKGLLCVGLFCLEILFVFLVYLIVFLYHEQFWLI